MPVLYGFEQPSIDIVKSDTHYLHCLNTGYLDHYFCPYEKHLKWYKLKVVDTPGVFYAWRYPDNPSVGLVILLVLNPNIWPDSAMLVYTRNGWMPLRDMSKPLIYSDIDVFNFPKVLGEFPINYSLDFGKEQISKFVARTKYSEKHFAEGVLFKLWEYPEYWILSEGKLVNVSPLVKALLGSNLTHKIEEKDNG